MIPMTSDGLEAMTAELRERLADMTSATSGGARRSRLFSVSAIIPSGSVLSLALLTPAAMRLASISSLGKWWKNGYGCCLVSVR